MAETLCIKDFKDVFWLFEAGRAVEVTWIKWPVARNSASFRRLMSSQAGHTAFCVFNGILRLVSRGRTGGVMTLKGRPITHEDINVETNIPVRLVAKGLEVLRSPEVAWIITIEEADRAAKERADSVAQTGKKRSNNVEHAASSRGRTSSLLSSDSGSGISGESEGATKQPAFPPALDRPEFKAKWAEWLAYRRERGLPALKPRSVAGQLKRCSGWGITAATAAIDNAIANAWQGLFEPKEFNRGNTRNPDARRADKASREFADESVLPVLQ